MIDYRWVAEKSDAAILGWRAWRVLPWRGVDGAPSYRLAACGTKGIPKVWQPRRAAEAVCSEYETLHDAPWPRCDCGIHAYEDGEEAEQHWHRFIGFNPKEVVGWAFGQVSMWGQVIECERGWRAQYAYPWALDVHAEPAVAAALRELYLVDVNALDPLEPPPDEPGDLLTELEEVEANVADLKARLVAHRAPSPRPSSSPTPRRDWRIIDPYQPLEVYVDAVAKAIEASGRPVVSSKDVAEQLPIPRWSKDDPTLPVASRYAITVGQLLSRYCLSDRIVRLQTLGKNGPYGRSYWTLPGRERKIPREVGAFRGLQPVPDSKWENGDQDVLVALERAVKEAKGEPVRINAVIAELDEPEVNLGPSFKSKVAQALIRCEYRLRVRSEGSPKHYAVAA